MDVYVEKVEIQKKETLYKLLQYSLFEESENDLNEMNEEALFEYKYFDSYFTDDDRDAYFIREIEKNKLLGFTMVNSYMQKCDNGHSIAEYMVIPKYRKNKIGKRAAFKIFDKYRGNWEIKPSFNSEKAFLFWKKTIGEYTNGNYRIEDGIFIFNNEI